MCVYIVLLTFHVKELFIAVSTVFHVVDIMSFDLAFAFVFLSYLLSDICCASGFSES